jgi:hypothetical protein
MQDLCKKQTVDAALLFVGSITMKSAVVVVFRQLLLHLASNNK